MKAAEKKRKLNEAAQEKIVKRHVALAEKVIAKLTEPVQNMEKNQQQPAAQQYIPLDLKSKAKAALIELRDMLSEAEKFVQGPHDTLMNVSGLNLKSISEKLSIAKKLDTNITMVLASIERAKLKE